MNFSAIEDIDAPIEDVFQIVSDFESFERSAMRRGAQVQRVDNLSAPAAGMMWDTRFTMRGRRRELHLLLDVYDVPNRLALKGTSQGLETSFEVDLMSLSRTRTRMSVELGLAPSSLSARLLVQSLKLAKTNLTKRFKLRVAEYAKEIEERCLRSA
ncbi:SRPBCC family protein [Aliishimia ponticola]|uniref:SRPBCC family protein n=1 Tax=Aliishimia ponticola TaxID=2499833 RepID=A0A4V3XKG4_9RHOB|nr:SRPBCC family protein [Aliishimia ponticola]THH36843.1 SRPBCC family protein [Aliishimia ponticola]